VEFRHRQRPCNNAHVISRFNPAVCGYFTSEDRIASVRSPSNTLRECGHAGTHTLAIRRLNWKFSSADIRERGFWSDYMDAFEEAIRTTAAPRAPWFVVPADNKWFTRLIVAAAIVETVERLDLRYPKIDAAKKKELVAARAALARER
jgi:hypothetical protein